MIKANELRIGNWLIANNSNDKNLKYGQVTHVYTAGDGGYTVDYHYPGSWFDPIPLTPEILEKAGFRQLWEGKWESDHITIEAEGSGYALFGSEWTIGKPIFYVHQLQNLHHILTGEELTVNL